MRKNFSTASENVGRKLPRKGHSIDTMPNSKSRTSTFDSEFIRIKFQTGLPPEVGVNGAKVEDVIDILCQKLEAFQLGSLPCKENEEALKHLQMARDAMVRRRQRRVLQGVYHTMTPHAERTEDMVEEFSATGA